MTTESKLSRARLANRNRMRRDGRRIRQFIETPLGRATLPDFLEALTKVLRGDLDDKPELPPKGLEPLLAQLDFEQQAFIVLACLLDPLYCGWEGGDHRSAKMLLRRKIGQGLHDRLALKKLFEVYPDLHPELHKGRVHENEQLVAEARKHPYKFVEPDWGVRECVRAGDWLLQRAQAMSCFTDPTPENPFPGIAPEWREDIDRVRDELLRHDWVYLPRTSRPPDWVKPTSESADRPQVRFVRGARGKQKDAIAKIFATGEFDHARAVSALQSVPLRINKRMIPVVERFAAEVMDRRGKQRKADEATVGEDTRVAKQLSGKPFWLDYNCEFRGRLVPLSYFNYARRDHVRSLFQFNNGAKLGPDGMEWLEIHVANCQGSTDKRPWGERIKWTRDKDKRDEIKKIANDPVGTFELWSRDDIDNPFQYVAACIELAEAWSDPANFTTHLPIGFDGSCNGIQHLCLIGRDHEAGRLVNLTDTDEPCDIYLAVAKEVQRAISFASDEGAQWWKNQLAGWDDRKVRKLAKQPVMTFPYGVSHSGMKKQIAENYREITKADLDDSDAKYLVGRVREACNKLLPGPTEVMKYIRLLAKHRAKGGQSLTWTTPSRFPVDNTYNKKAEPKRLYCGTREYLVSEGYLPDLDRAPMVSGSAPNFVHSMDAAHLALTVNDAVQRGITDLLTVHDLFLCLAPYSAEFGRVLRVQMALMYKSYDALRTLRDFNGLDATEFPLPEYGKLDVFDLQRAEWVFA